jgi:hypothetical protein
VVYNMGEDASTFDAYRRKWFDVFSPLLHSTVIYPVVGNHDIESATLWNGVPFYYHVFPPFADPQFAPSDDAGKRRWYAFAYGDLQFVMLDTQAFFGEGGSAAQDAWLAGRLADSRFKHTIAVFHVPPYDAGRHVTDSPPVRVDWSPQFEAAGVPLVLSGHDHNYQRFLEDGTTYVISGGGSATLYAQTQTPDGLQAFARQTHYVLLEVYADHIDLTAIALGGAVIDQATIPLP